MPAESAADRASARIEALLEEVQATASADLVARVEELVKTIVGLYGEGLARIARVLGDPHAGLDGAWSPLKSDPLVSALLVLHGLHPDDVRARVEDALVRVTPYLPAHAGGVSLSAIEAGGVARIRLKGTCGGCASSAATVKGLIERAVREAAPEITRIELDEPLGRAPGKARADSAAQGSAMTARVLVAGVGNVFLGDDGFGTEVARRLAGVPLAAGARVEDYGIRALHLAYALLEGYDAIVLIDAMARGEAPGTVFVVEPDLTTLDQNAATLDAHTLHPEAVLRMAQSLGARIGRVRVVGCEPAYIEEHMGLSAPVEQAVSTAIEVVRKLVHELVLDLCNDGEVTQSTPRNTQ